MQRQKSVLQRERPRAVVAEVLMLEPGGPSWRDICGVNDATARASQRRQSVTEMEPSHRDQ